MSARRQQQVTPHESRSPQTDMQVAIPLNDIRNNMTHCGNYSRDKPLF